MIAQRFGLMGCRGEVGEQTGRFCVVPQEAPGSALGQHQFWISGGSCMLERFLDKPQGVQCLLCDSPGYQAQRDTP